MCWPTRREPLWASSASSSSAPGPKCAMPHGHCPFATRVMAVPSDRVDATLKGFTSWAGSASPKLSGDPDADAEELRMLLDLLGDHLGVDDPAGLRPGDLRELLLQVYPRKVTVLDAKDMADTVPALRDLLTFLADTGAMASKAATRLARELDEIAPLFESAVMNPGNWGMARALAQAMVSDGVDFGDRDAVDRWLVGHNARMDPGLADDENPFGDLAEDGAGADNLEPGSLELDDEFELDDWDIDLKEAFGLPDRMPPVRLPAQPELAAMCRDAPLLGRARRLAEWAAPGRAVTWEGELTAADTVAAAREMGVAVPVASDTAAEALPGMPELPAVTGMRDVPELARVWEIALDVGFLELDDDEARTEPGEAMDCWPGGTDEESLDVWSTALASVLGRLEEDAALDTVRGRQLDFIGAGGGLIMLLFLGGQAGLPVSEASDAIREVAIAELAPVKAAKAWRSWTRRHGDPAEDLLGQLAELGAVSLPDQPPGQPSGDSSDDGRVAQLAPLGIWAMREQLADDGVEIPLLPPSDQMTAGDLLAAAEELGEEETEAETAAWLELRAPDVAAGELLAAAANGCPAERLFAIGTVNRLGTAAEPAWRDVLGRPELRPYAKIALTEIAGGEPGVTVLAGLEPELADLAWLLTDVLAALSDDPDELSQQIHDSVPPGQEQQIFDAMARSPHPDAATALSLIGQHHPDKRIAKAARRSAYRAASRPKPAR
jgi:hypothetical protein